jgi:aryl carrier-like protein
MTDLPDLDATIVKYATSRFDDDTRLLDTGLDSLSLVRLAVEVAHDKDGEIDAARLIGLRTVGELKDWLREIAGPGVAV